MCARGSMPRLRSSRRGRSVARRAPWRVLALQRFADGATVVVQTPGMLPYFLRMPTAVDLRGLSPGARPTRRPMQALDPEVMIPLGKIVASEPVRLAMAADWDWKRLASHVQHAIMQSRDWEVSARFTPPGSTCTCANLPVPAKVGGHLCPRGRRCARGTEKERRMRASTR